SCLCLCLIAQQGPYLRLRPRFASSGSSVQARGFHIPWTAPPSRTCRPSVRCCSRVSSFSFLSSASGMLGTAAQIGNPACGSMSSWRNEGLSHRPFRPFSTRRLHSLRLTCASV
ncbi:hypothetical protein RB213_002475, partial [Colletotrichum asianum]